MNMPAMHSDTTRAHIDILGGATMGTTWSVKLVTARRNDLHVLHAAIQAQLDRVVAQMSNWEADSDISRYNAAPAGTWHVLPDAFWTVLSCALDIARTSGGAYDPTVGPLVDAWGFGPSARCLELAAREAAHERVGWTRVVVDASQQRVLQPGRVQLDLCAIAKGHAVDAVAGELRRLGIESALVEVGGELYGFGHKPDGSPWRVIVEGWQGDEDDANEPRVLALDGLAVATSGDRWHRRFEQDREFSHTLDPRSGRPVENAPVAVTVAARDAMHADGWATALTVLGMHAGHAFAVEHGLAARFVDVRADGSIDERMTPAFEVLLAA